MYTANTMATAIEVLGMSLPGSSSHPAESADKKADIEEAGRAVVKMLEMGLKPSDILTREAFEDAITVTMALGGSTNATLHLLAIAHASFGGLETFREICLPRPLQCRWCASRHEIPS